MKMIRKTLVINGLPTQVIADPEQNLAKVLREQLGLLVKIGCGNAQELILSRWRQGPLSMFQMRRVPDGRRSLFEGISSPTICIPYRSIHQAWCLSVRMLYSRFYCFDKGLWKKKAQAVRIFELVQRPGMFTVTQRLQTCCRCSDRAPR